MTDPNVCFVGDIDSGVDDSPPVCLVQLVHNKHIKQFNPETKTPDHTLSSMDSNEAVLTDTTHRDVSGNSVPTSYPTSPLSNRNHTKSPPITSVDSAALDAPTTTTAIDGVYHDDFDAEDLPLTVDIPEEVYSGTNDAVWVISQNDRAAIQSPCESQSNMASSPQKPEDYSCFPANTDVKITFADGQNPTTSSFIGLSCSSSSHTYNNINVMFDSSCTLPPSNPSGTTHTLLQVDRNDISTSSTGNTIADTMTQPICSDSSADQTSSSIGALDILPKPTFSQSIPSTLPTAPMPMSPVTVPLPSHTAIHLMPYMTGVNGPHFSNSPLTLGNLSGANATLPFSGPAAPPNGSLQILNMTPMPQFMNAQGIFLHAGSTAFPAPCPPLMSGIPGSTPTLSFLHPAHQTFTTLLQSPTVGSTDFLLDPSLGLGHPFCSSGSMAIINSMHHNPSAMESLATNPLTSIYSGVLQSAQPALPASSMLANSPSLILPSHYRTCMTGNTHLVNSTAPQMSTSMASNGGANLFSSQTLSLNNPSGASANLFLHPTPTSLLPSTFGVTSGPLLQPCQFSPYPVPMQGPTDTCFSTSMTHDLTGSALPTARVEQLEPCFSSTSHVCPVTIQASTNMPLSVTPLNPTYLTHPSVAQANPTFTKRPCRPSLPLRCGAPHLLSSRSAVSSSSLRPTTTTTTGCYSAVRSLPLAPAAISGDTGITRNSIAMLPAPRRRRPFGHVMPKAVIKNPPPTSSLPTTYNSTTEPDAACNHVTTLTHGHADEVSFARSSPVAVSTVALPSLALPGYLESVCSSSPSSPATHLGSESPPTNMSIPSSTDIPSLPVSSQDVLTISFSEDSSKRTTVAHDSNSLCHSATSEATPSALHLGHATVAPSTSCSTASVTASPYSSLFDSPSAVRRKVHSTKSSPSARPQPCSLPNGCSASVDLHTSLERLGVTCSAVHSDLVEFHNHTSTPLEATGLFPVNRRSQSLFGVHVPQMPPTVLHHGPDEHRILTHVVDGYVIYESNKPFPVKNGLAIVEAALLHQCIHEENASHSISPSKVEVNNHLENHPVNGSEQELLDEADTEKLGEESKVTKSPSHFRLDELPEPTSRCLKESFSSTVPRLVDAAPLPAGNATDRRDHESTCAESNLSVGVTKCSRDNIFSVLQIETAIAKAVSDRPLADDFSPIPKSVVSTATTSERMTAISSFPFGSVSYSRIGSFRDENLSFGSFRTQSNAPFSCASIYANFTPAPPPPGPVCKWTPDDVVAFVQSTPGCSAYAASFLNNEIDGEALLLLAKDQFIQPPIGMKIGPALKLAARLESIRHLS